MKTTKRADDDRDIGLLAGLSAWEQLFGKFPLSWGELKSMGLKVTAEEVAQCLANPAKSGLYKILLVQHPELKAFLIHAGFLPAPWKQKNVEHHFIAKLTVGGDPIPNSNSITFVRKPRNRQVVLPSSLHEQRGASGCVRRPTGGLRLVSFSIEPKRE